MLEDASQSGRPVEVDSDQNETLIENNQCYTTLEIANILKISKSIRLLLKIKNVSFILQKEPYELFDQPNTSASIKFWVDDFAQLFENHILLVSGIYCC